MADKKKIILAVLAVISVFVWGSRGLGIFSKNKQAKARSKGGVFPLSKAEGRQAPRSEYKDYKRNPFTTAPPVSHSQSAGLQLGGIMYDDKELCCLINDQIMHIGDTIGAYRVVAITKNKVTLSDGTKEIELKLEE